MSSHLRHYSKVIRAEFACEKVHELKVETCIWLKWHKNPICLKSLATKKTIRVSFACRLLALLQLAPSQLYINNQTADFWVSAVIQWSSASQPASPLVLALRTAEFRQQRTLCLYLASRKMAADFLAFLRDGIDFSAQVMNWEFERICGASLWLWEDWSDRARVGFASEKRL